VGVFCELFCEFSGSRLEEFAAHFGPFQMVQEAKSVAPLELAGRKVCRA